MPQYVNVSLTNAHMRSVILSDAPLCALSVIILSGTGAVNKKKKRDSGCEYTKTVPGV
jgi:hypothetical protein